MVANANAAIPVKGAVPVSGAVVSMPNNRPTICTADQANCVAITSRLHYDVGGYDYNPNTAATVPQKLDSGQNVRRARIGLTGKFLQRLEFRARLRFRRQRPTALAVLHAGLHCRAAAPPASRTPISATPASSRLAAGWR